MNSKLIKITIGDTTKIFLIGQNDIAKEEIENYYKNYTKETGKKLNMEEFLFEIKQYGIELTEINPEVMSIAL